MLLCFFPLCCPSHSLAITPSSYQEAAASDDNSSARERHKDKKSKKEKKEKRSKEKKKKTKKTKKSKKKKKDAKEAKDDSSSSSKSKRRKESSSSSSSLSSSDSELETRGHSSVRHSSDDEEDNVGRRENDGKP
jgi:hypothetical protein